MTHLHSLLDTARRRAAAGFWGASHYNADLSLGPTSDAAGNAEHVVWKVSTRCNLRCRYCYVYSGEDRWWDGRYEEPSLASIASLTALIDERASHGVRAFDLVLHGGEPTIVPPEELEHAIDIVEAHARSAGMKLSLAMQTNGTLFDDRWLSLIERKQIAVGVSLDGARSTHDGERGRSHERAVGTVRALLDRLPQQFAGVLCVLSDTLGDETTQLDFLHSLGVRRLDLLSRLEPATGSLSLTRSSTRAAIAREVDCWIRLGDPELAVRSIDFGLCRQLDRTGGCVSVFPDGAVRPERIAPRHDVSIWRNVLGERIAELAAC